MPDRRLLARAIADAFLAGDWEPRAMAARAAPAISPPGDAWLHGVAKRMRARFALPPVRVALLAAAILRSRGFERAAGTEAHRVVAPVVTPTQMRAPTSLALDVGQPLLHTTLDLSRWLGLTASELDWFAGCRGGERGAGPGPLRHYRFEVRIKPSGRARVLEAPRPRLCALQRHILHELLDLVPVSPHAHGFVRGRSALTGAAHHAGREIVLRLDLADFFNSIAAGRVFGTFAALGYPEAVARALTGLTTLETPRDVLASIPFSAAPGALDDRHRQRLLLRQRHLPQGAPTSPALANLVAFGLDRRLAGLAARMGASYTRYADDLVFSGDARLASASTRFLAKATEIIREEGFVPRGDKTLRMRASARQRVTGLIVNRFPNVPREAFDELKAILHNCARTGPDAQNRHGEPDFRAHLRGRIAWVKEVAPARGAKLLAMFEQIDWASS